MEPIVSGGTTLPVGLPLLGRAPWRILNDVDQATIEGLACLFRSGQPFPHLVIDGLFDPEFLRNICESFEELPAGSWGLSNHRLQKKAGTASDARLPDIAKCYFDNLNSVPMRRFLSRTTGIEGLLPDPSLYSGGMHKVPDGGLFELHTDFAYHPTTLCRNRIAVITYLNEGWQAEFGGALELWQSSPRVRIAPILPVFGRTIVMEVGPRNVHGHPDAVRAPEGRSRRSLSAYFYTECVSSGLDRRTSTTAYVDRPTAGFDVRTIRFIYAAMPRPVAAAARKVLGRRKWLRTTSRGSRRR